MTSPEVFDVTALLQAISDDRPCGHDLRHDMSQTSVYHKIKDARHEARRAERQAEIGDENGDAPNWRLVEDLGLEILTAHSKDLQIVAWLLEASVRRHGFAGLRDGFHLAHGLIERFWPDLFPAEEDEGVVDKIAPLAGLNGDGVEGVLIAPLRLTPLTGGDPTFSLYDYEQAMNLVTTIDPEVQEQRRAEGALSFDQLAAVGAANGGSFYQDLLDDIEAAMDALGRLDQVIAEKCGEGAMPSSAIRNVLDRCCDAARQIAGPLVSVSTPSEQCVQTIEQNETTDARLAEAASTPVVAAHADTLGSREDAFRKLLDIAAYFRRTEPHSPVPYALEQAVRWGRMGLPELMEELVIDEDSRGRLFSLTGIRPG